MSDTEIPDTHANLLALLLHKVGNLDGKLEGIAVGIEDIKADNIRCNADRDNIYVEMRKIEDKQGKRIGKIENKQYWMAGVAVGASIFMTKLLSGFGWVNVPH
jgi:hypothetical protein